MHWIVLQLNEYYFTNIVKVKIKPLIGIISHQQGENIGNVILIVQYTV